MTRTTMQTLLMGLVACVCLAVPIFAQAAPAPAPSNPYPGDVVPESGFLSQSKYTNAFFGFTLELPRDADLRELNLTIKGATWGHFLFGIQSQQNGLSTFTITAKEAGKDDSNAAQNAASDQMPRAKRVEIAGREFWKSTAQEKSSVGKMQKVAFATTLNGYVLKFYTLSFDAKLTSRLEQSVEALTFFDPATSKEMAGADSKPYNPSSVQRSIPVVPVSKRIAGLSDGSISGNSYRNEELGFRYEFPAGWIVNDEATRKKVAEVGHHFVWGDDPSAALEHQAFEQCAKVLLFVTRYPEGIKTEELNPIVELMAADPACAPGAQFPKTVDDHEAIQQIARQIVEKFKGTPLAGNGQARVRAFKAGEKVLVEVSQSFSINAPGSTAPTNVFTSMVLMEARDYWILWMLMSGNEAELKELKSTKIFFDNPEGANSPSPGQTPSK